MAHSLRSARTVAAITIRVAVGAVAVASLAAVVAVAGLRAGGHEMIVVQGASMGDALPLGSIVATESISAEQVRRGDVVLVSEPGATPFLHRITSLSRSGSQVVVRTKGDANDKPDPHEYILPASVKRATFELPYAGYILAQTRAPIARMAMLTLLVALFAIMALRRIFASGRSVSAPENEVLPEVVVEPAPAPVAIRPAAPAARRQGGTAAGLVALGGLVLAGLALRRALAASR